MLKKILQCCELARFKAYTGYLLVFFPAAYALVLASKSVVDLKLLSLFFVASIITRGAGCIVNDIFDRDLDKHVTRTKNRPLTSGMLDLKTAIIFLAILSIASLSILLSLNRTAIYLGVVASMLIIIYPLMKRITNLPQLFLGIVFNFGALIAYAEVSSNVPQAAWCLYLGCCAWTIGYDAIYAFMDLQDDKKIAIRSIAIALENRNYKLWLSMLYVLFIILFVVASIIANKSANLLAIMLASTLLVWQIYTLNIHSYENCLCRFKSNNYVGAILLLSIMV